MKLQSLENGGDIILLQGTKWETRLTTQQINDAFKKTLDWIEERAINKLVFYWFSSSEILEIKEKIGTWFTIGLSDIIAEVEAIYGIPEKLTLEKKEQVKSHLAQMFSEMKFANRDDMEDYLAMIKKFENEELIS